MAFIDKTTRIIVQGITGHQGSFHSGEMIKFGAKVVGGTSPGKGGTMVNNVPVFSTVADAMSLNPCASMISVPAPFTKKAFFEALDAGIKLIYVLTEHVPKHDEIEMSATAEKYGAVMIGPNGPGITVPFETKMGIMPNHIFKKGSVAIASRSGTLTYEVVRAVTDSGLGESTVIGLGGDAVVGIRFVDVLKAIKDDDDTRSVVLLGEIGGTAEEEAAEYMIREKFSKQVVAYIAGRSAPPGKRMGHAGAIISRGKGTANSKIKALTDAGVKIADFPQDIPKLIVADRGQQ